MYLQFYQPYTFSTISATSIIYNSFTTFFCTFKLFFLLFIIISVCGFMYTAYTLYLCIRGMWKHYKWSHWNRHTMRSTQAVLMGSFHITIDQIPCTHQNILLGSPPVLQNCYHFLHILHMWTPHTSVIHCCSSSVGLLPCIEGIAGIRSRSAIETAEVAIQGREAVSGMAWKACNHYQDGGGKASCHGERIEHALAVNTVVGPEETARSHKWVRRRVASSLQVPYMYLGHVPTTHAHLQFPGSAGCWQVSFGHCIDSTHSSPNSNKPSGQKQPVNMRYNLNH